MGILAVYKKEGIKSTHRSEFSDNYTLYQKLYSIKLSEMIKYQSCAILFTIEIKKITLFLVRNPYM